MRTRRNQTSSNSVPSPNGDMHQSVLLHEVLDGLAIQSSHTIVDGTAGGGGHSRAIAEQLGEDGVIVALDADADAVERTQKVLEGVSPTVHCVQENFRHLSTVLAGLNITAIDAALFDLGWSSNQLRSGRGFSFQQDEPLLMTYGEVGPETLTAAQIVNEWEEENIADILFGWGEETLSRRIARAIVARRKEKAIETSVELADIVSNAVPARFRHKKIHPATKTFQALRIAVNDEMGATTDGLEAAHTFLASGGRIAVITFHSIEDRLVKRTFRTWEKDGIGTIITKKPIQPSEEEVANNPRSRSAKLRIFEKI